MKTTILTTMCLTVLLMACAKTPPKQVSDEFSKKFASITKVKWDQEEANEWEAEFKNNGKEMSVSFDTLGNWQETEIKISKKDIAVEALKAIQLKYEDWKIIKTEQIETPDFKGYEIVIEKDKKEIELLVTASGEITVKIESSEKENNDKK